MIEELKKVDPRIDFNGDVNLGHKFIYCAQRLFSK